MMLVTVVGLVMAVTAPSRGNTVIKINHISILAVSHIDGIRVTGIHKYSFWNMADHRLTPPENILTNGRHDFRFPEAAQPMEIQAEFIACFIGCKFGQRASPPVDHKTDHN